MMTFKHKSSFLLLLTASMVISACTIQQPLPTNAVARVPEAHSSLPECDSGQSKIDGQDCLSLNKSDNQIKSENSNVLQHGTSEILDSRINTTE
jgi:hypothetical protein